MSGKVKHYLSIACRTIRSVTRGTMLAPCENPLGTLLEPCHSHIRSQWAYLLQMVLENGALWLRQWGDLITGGRCCYLIGIQVHQPHVIWESVRECV